MKQPQTLKLRNGVKLPSIFSSDEMQNQLMKSRKGMGEIGVDGVLLTSFHIINYFDHILYTAFGRNYGLVFSSNRICSVTAIIDGG